jgi:hypothetical protein
MFRRHRLDCSFCAKKAGAAAPSSARPEAVLQGVTAIGGATRYDTRNWLWWLREAIDWAIGGPGFPSGWRDAPAPHLGATIDDRAVIGVSNRLGG